MSRIGLLAGEGDIPVLFADIAKSKGDKVIAFCLNGITNKEIDKHADRTHWLDWGSLKKAMFLVATERINKVVMLGKIRKELLFKGAKEFDSAAKKTFGNDMKDYSLLNKAANLLSTIGVEVIDSTIYLKEFIPQKGILTKRAPTAKEAEDIEFGRKIASESANMDTGQTIAVKDKTVIAVEAAEGTDETIRRAGSLTAGGFVIVKVARPNQDMRFDVPVVGPDTIETAIRAGAACLALESGKTILLGKEAVIRLADENGLAVLII